MVDFELLVTFFYTTFRFSGRRSEFCSRFLFPAIWYVLYGRRAEKSDIQHWPLDWPLRTLRTYVRNYEYISMYLQYFLYSGLQSRESRVWSGIA